MIFMDITNTKNNSYVLLSMILNMSKNLLKYSVLELLWENSFSHMRYSIYIYIHIHTYTYIHVNINIYM
jgi:hypothetical protein